jgi:hypothetical protein
MRTLAELCRGELLEGEVERSLERLRPIVSSRTPFPLLDLAGRTIAEAARASPSEFLALLDGLAGTEAIGAWPCIGSALAAAHLPDEIPCAFEQTRRYILLAGVWHATDALAERVPGEGLRVGFDRTVALLRTWRGGSSAWLRRAVGVAAHYYAKRERDEPVRAAQLLDLLAPLFEERATTAAKGIGWGLKTIGRYYPDLLTDWLRGQLTSRQPRRLTVRKAVTYLPERARVEFL